ncbi:uncharacterized protein LOC115626700 [Scaptodrosophila lebanonensis]|uniref:Uncharacterized protein LOC115626700 n=1 Tax=Drosophila lebanonensis TaxID=7225 RepID=A0A6J2TPL6_DROLE|nr:uncharacterized protein LOC115626700 [Scaptodrosophila lebanonensis]
MTQFTTKQQIIALLRSAILGPDINKMPRPRRSTEGEASAYCEAFTQTLEAFEEENVNDVSVFVCMDGMNGSKEAGPAAKPPLANRCNSVIRALARIVQNVSERILVALGINRENAAWYKHCSQNPGSHHCLLGSNRDLDDRTSSSDSCDDLTLCNEVIHV